jgi:hypothetical protein
MRQSRVGLILLLLWASVAAAQVVSPAEIKDPAMRKLQTRHLKQLKAIGAELQQQHFPFPFYFSRTLDMEEAIQKQSDQRSIRFDVYDNQTALEITGNYYAAYSEKHEDADHRVRSTYEAVIRPILQAVVPPLYQSTDFDLFAIEVSHHVRRKVMGLDSELAENVVVLIPRELAERVVQAQDPAEQQRLLLDAQVFRNAEPTVIWLAGARPFNPQEQSEQAAVPASRPAKRIRASLPPVRAAEERAPATAPPSRTYAPAAPVAPIIAPLPKLHAEPLHTPSPDALKQLQSQYQKAIDTLVQEQGKEAHFVSYAPPAFIAFKRGSYLQLSLTTPLEANVDDSRYKLAALAFDRHISHLVRPVLGYFKDDAGFDGIDFSTTVKISGDSDNSHSLAVEYILPFSAMHCFQQFDCTGQQLLNAGIILINGERAGLELQTAEAR